MKIYLQYFFKFKIYLIVVTILLNSSTFSQIELDTVQHKQVGPGMFYTKMVVHAVPWNIDVFEADMTNQYFAIETVKAFEVLAGGREKTSSMSARRNFAGHWSVGAVNGDFFDMTTGMPNNIQVENGEVLRNERADWPTVGFNSNNEVSISEPNFSGALMLKDSSLAISGINKVREENELIFYNQFFGESTGTSNEGFEAIVNPINTWLANDTVYCVVDSISSVGQNTIIPDGSMVVSANGTIANYMSSHISINDTLKILLNILPSVNMLKEMMGGHPIVIRDGFSVSMDPNNSFVYTRHPRTAVGINKDTTKLFLVTVDGRQASSLGMNLYELADLMLQIGIYQGINLDGGGSTTMVIRNEVVNSPSDTSGERPVSNALLVISKEPMDY
jgi:exopolysaccharide biosynthesis protein